MSKKKSSKSKKMWSCDFETTTSKISNEETKVWSWGVIGIDGFFDNFTYGLNIETFMDWAIPSGDILYFHNLKFDGQFLVSYLLKNGFTWEVPKDKNDRYIEEGTFQASVTDMGTWYMIKICTRDEKGKRVITEIRDSAKKLPMSVDRIAKSFRLPVLKGDIDYDRDPDLPLTDNELEYLRNDVEIVARALYKQIIEEGLDKLTCGSDSMAHFKTTLGGNSNSRNESIFRSLFPDVGLEMDSLLREAYRGGFTWVNPRFQGKQVGKGKVFDVNSLYPAMMYYKMLPYGMPIYFEGEYKQDDEYPLYIMRVKFAFKLKENHIPTIQIKGNFRYAGNEYIESSNGEIEDLWFTSVDWELIKDHYDFVGEPEFIEGYMFKGKIGMFKTFIDFWTEIKIDPANKGGKRELAKGQLNNLYGKFATNPKGRNKKGDLHEDGVVRYTVYDKPDGEAVYTALSAFVTAYGRDTTIRTAQKCFNRICYCDTDSIHLIGEEVPEAIEDMIHDDDLGMWAHESDFIRAKFVRQKTYVEDVIDRETGETEVDVKCAGMPPSVKQYVTFENFKIGFAHDPKEISKMSDEEFDVRYKGKSRKEIKFKLQPRTINGGVVLRDVGFSIK